MPLVLQLLNQKYSTADLVKKKEKRKKEHLRLHTSPRYEARLPCTPRRLGDYPRLPKALRKGRKTAFKRVPEKRGLLPRAVPRGGCPCQGRSPAQPASPAAPAARPVPHGAPPQSLGPAVQGHAPAATHRLTTPVLILICLRRGSAMAAAP